MTALAQGTLEKVGAVVYERHFHAPASQSAEWLSRCLGQARAGLDQLTRRLAAPYSCGASLSHADVMITTLIWYMQDRMDEVLSPSAHAALISLGPVHTIFARCVAIKKGQAQGAKRSWGATPARLGNAANGPF